MARIDALLTETVKAGASDLHMVPGFAPMLRVKGDLVPTKYNQLSHKLNEQLFLRNNPAGTARSIKNKFGVGLRLRAGRRGAISLQLFLYDERHGRCFPADPVEDYDS